MEQDPDPSDTYVGTLNQNDDTRPHATASLTTTDTTVATTPGSRSLVLLLGFFVFSLGFFVLGYVGSIDELPLMGQFIDAYCPGWQGLDASECHNPPVPWLAFVHWYLRVYAVGTILGVLVAGLVIVDKFGRRAGIFSAALFSTSCAVLILVPVQVRALILLLLGLQGLGLGMITFSSVLLWVEIAPTEVRGVLGGIIQTVVVASPLLLIAANESGNGGLPESWRLMYAPALVGSLLVLLSAYAIPASPRWSYRALGKEASEAALKRARHTTNIHTELQGIRREAQALQGRGGSMARLSALIRRS